MLFSIKAVFNNSYVKAGDSLKYKYLKYKIENTIVLNQ